MLLWVFAVAVFACCAVASAQQATPSGQMGAIRGVVYDDDFGEPLAGAVVRIAENGREATTSDQGNYVFRDVPQGSYTLVVARDGYTREVKTGVTVTPGELADVDVRLTGDFARMEDFVVQELQLAAGSEQQLMELRFDSPTLLDSVGQDLISQSGAGDAADALRLVTGATVRDNKAVVRGLPDRYVSSQFNGVRMPSADAETRSVELDQFPSDVIESVQVSKTFTPDQQGDASGGAVNIISKSIPDDTIFEISIGTSYNTQVHGNDDFLTYDDGGVNFLGIDDERADNDNAAALNDLSSTAVGVSRDNPALDYSMSMTLGTKHEFDNGIAIGGFASVFYDRSSSYYEDGAEDSLWLFDDSSRELTPVFSGQRPNRTTNLLDITQGSEQVQWGGLAGLGMESEHHTLRFTFLHTRTTEDTATLAEDTRGKQAFHPGHEPNDPDSPGHDDDITDAPYQRFETLNYVERTLQTIQLGGTHTLPIPEFGLEDRFHVLSPEIGWTLSHNEAEEERPDKRQFGSRWQPDQPGETIFIGGQPFELDPVPATHFPQRPATGASIGHIQRTFESTAEEGEQYSAYLKIPFMQWSDNEGYLQLGVFDDSVERTFKQDTFSNSFNSSTSSSDVAYEAPFEDYYSDAWPTLPQANDFSAFQGDIDYNGTYDIAAWYWMVDVPFTPWLRTVGGIRFESTDISIVTDPERESSIVRLDGGRATVWDDYDEGIRATDPDTGLPLGDSEFYQDDVLPSLAVVLTPLESVTLRASYARTIARQTFRELSPITQQEFLGGDVFIGNPTLQASEVDNYDLRLDLTPAEGSFLSASVFQKDITDPIEVVQRLPDDGSFVFDRPVNFPEGRMRGVEFELRQDIGRLIDRAWLDGLSVGANATFIDSEVQLPEDERGQLDSALGRNTAITERDMVNAPEYLLNFNITYKLERTGTRLGLFYLMQGDMLVAGPGQKSGNFIPSRYQEGYGTLNFTLAQELGEHFTLSFKAKNLTDPEIREVYRSEYTSETTHSSYTKGIDLSLGLSAHFTF